VAVTRYTPEDMDGLRTVLGDERLTDEMKVEADEDTGVTEKTVGELRARTTWPGDLVVIIPREHLPGSRGENQQAFCVTARRFPPPVSRGIGRLLCREGQREAETSLRLFRG
jgi:hypothetical protein